MTLALGAIAALLLAGVLYQFAGRRLDATRLPPAGRMFDIGGARLHIDIAGVPGTPVVFEAGIAASSLSWRLVQPQVARFTQAVSYDRAGLGWSDPIPRPRDVATLRDELRALLIQAAVPAPRVIVAHSFGGMIALAYASEFPGEVAGLVLVDPVGIAEWRAPSQLHRRMLQRGILLSAFGEFLARIGVVRGALALVAAGSRRLPKLIARASSGRSGQAFTERMAGEIRKLPREVWPAIQSHWSDPKCFRSMRNYLRSLPESAASVFTGAAKLNLPLVVLSAGNSSPAQRADHQRVARWSSRGRIEIVPDSGHWMMLDRPDLVISEIKRILDEISRKESA